MRRSWVPGFHSSLPAIEGAVLGPINPQECPPACAEIGNGLISCRVAVFAGVRRSYHVTIIPLSRVALSAFSAPHVQFGYHSRPRVGVFVEGGPVLAHAVSFPPNVTIASPSFP